MPLTALCSSRPWSAWRDIWRDHCFRGPLEQSPNVSEDASCLLPLSPARLHILLALAGEDRYGDAIMRTWRPAEGQYRIGPGTPYQSRKADDQRDGRRHRAAVDRPRRRYYRLTSFGRRVLAAEIVRLEEVVRAARAHCRVYGSWLHRWNLWLISVDGGRPNATPHSGTVRAE
jgi:DNA-binding PadR family transcriptional regulator